MINKEPRIKKNVTETMMPDLTPMLDVMFMLLFFFILTSATPLTTISVDIPSSEDVEIIESEGKESSLEITKDGYYFEGKKYANLDELKTIFPTLKEKEIIIAADKEATAKNIFPLLAALAKEGIEATDILLEKE